MIRKSNDDLLLGDLMQSNVSTSPDGRHWEPALPVVWRPFKERWRDALAVWRGDAVAVRQTRPEDYQEDRP